MHKRGTTFSNLQKKFMVDFLIKHPKMISGKFTSDYTFKDGQRSWQKLSNLLNELDGATKSWKQWRKSWHDMRTHVKVKIRRSKRPGGKARTKMLTRTEKNILNIINPLTTDTGFEKYYSQNNIDQQSETSDSDQIDFEIEMEERQPEELETNEKITSETPDEDIRRSDTKAFEVTHKNMKNEIDMFAKKNKTNVATTSSMEVIQSADRGQLINKDYQNSKRNYKLRKLTIIEKQQLIKEERLKLQERRIRVQERIVDALEKFVETISKMSSDVFK